MNVFLFCGDVFLLKRVISSHNSCGSMLFCVKCVKCIKARFKFSLKNTTIFLHFVWFCCSRVFHWCYIVVLLVFRGVPLVFQDVPLFCHCSEVFCCSTSVPCFIVPCSGVPSFIVCCIFARMYSMPSTY